MQQIDTILAIRIILFLLNISAARPAKGRSTRADTESRDAIVVAMVRGAPRLSANFVIKGVTI